MDATNFQKEPIYLLEMEKYSKTSISTLSCGDETQCYKSNAALRSANSGLLIPIPPALETYTSHACYVDVISCWLF